MRIFHRKIITTVATAVFLSASATACTATIQPRAGVVYVRQGPPPRIVEVRGAAPGREYLWINGYHQWRGNAYVWVPGRWTLPDRGFRKWQEGQWRHDRNGWYWVDGHWR